MKDRIPTYPGLVELTDPDTGISKLYYMAMADNPTEAGTPLNKNTLLSDAAAAAVWPVAGDRPDNPLVSDALTENSHGKVVLLTDGETYTNTTHNYKSIDIPLAEPFENFSRLDIYILADLWSYSNSVSVVNSSNVATAIGYFMGSNGANDIAHAAISILHNDTDGFLTMSETIGAGDTKYSGVSKATGNTLRTYMAYDDESPYSLTYKVYVFGTRK